MTLLPVERRDAESPEVRKPTWLARPTSHHGTEAEAEEAEEEEEEEEDDTIARSSASLAALQAFVAEREERERALTVVAAAAAAATSPAGEPLSAPVPVLSMEVFEENWQLSQFW
jgi:hypothetical protein